MGAHKKLFYGEILINLTCMVFMYFFVAIFVKTVRNAHLTLISALGCILYLEKCFKSTRTVNINGSSISNLMIQLNFNLLDLDDTQ